MIKTNHDPVDSRLRFKLAKFVVYERFAAGISMRDFLDIPSIARQFIIDNIAIEIGVRAGMQVVPPIVLKSCRGDIVATAWTRPARNG